MYLTVAEKKERVTSKALSSSRHELEENKIEMLEKDMFESEKIGEFIDLKNLDDMILPHGFTCLKRDNFVAFLLISNADCLSISTSLKIDLNLIVIVHHNSVLMNNKIFSHILSNSGKISSVTEVANLLATIKSWVINDNESHSNEKQSFQLAINILKTIESESSEVTSLLNFCIEQLQLCVLPKKSPTLQSRTFCNLISMAHQQS